VALAARLDRMLRSGTSAAVLAVALDEAATRIRILALDGQTAPVVVLSGAADRAADAIGRRSAVPSPVPQQPSVEQPSATRRPA
jgi:hypothetical protein